MPTVSIRPNAGSSVADSRFHATTDGRESWGNTPGAALDALAAQLDPGVLQRLFVVIEPLADDDLTPEQRRRLDELKSKYRLSTAGNGEMSTEDRDEMERLFDARFAAAERRALAASRGRL
jgi:hypothetical protein